MEGERKGKMEKEGTGKGRKIEGRESDKVPPLLVKVTPMDLSPPITF